MAREKKVELFEFPMAGVNVVSMKNKQPPKTCIDAKNVRPFDTIEARARGGSRPGLARYNASQLNGALRIQDLNYVTTISTSIVVGSMSRRTIIPVAVVNGVIMKFTTSSVTNASVAGSQVLGNATQTPFAFSAELFGRLYYADGYGYKIYVGSNNAAIDWSPTSGSLPGDEGNNIVCRLIESWRGRIVLAGLASDPYNFFMAKLGDPLDFDYTEVPATELSAVQGGTGFIGKVPDVINAIIPYSDDVLIFGCDHSIWMMSGDPAAGGRFDLITNTVGMSFGRPYTQLPDGSLIFFSNSGSIYKMSAGGGRPVSISQESIDPLITNTNLNTSIVRLAYEEAVEGIHVYISPLTNAAATHWFYDIRNEGWFKVVFGANNHNPIALMTFDGDLPTDRVIILGSEDGYVNIFDTTAFEDITDDFTSYAIMGPIVVEEGRIPTVLTDLQLVMDDTSANVKYEIGNGDTAEDGIAQFSALFTGATHPDNTVQVIGAGKSVNINPRTRGYFQYFKIGQTTATGPWAIEYIQATYGSVRTSTGRNFLTETFQYSAPGNAPFTNTTGLIMAFNAGHNITVSSGNVTNWTFYQQADTGNTKPKFVPNGNSAQVAYTASDPLMDDKPSILVRTSHSLISNAAINGMDHTNGFVTFVGYMDANPWDSGSLFKYVGSGAMEHRVGNTSATEWGYQVQDNGTNTKPDSYVGTVVKNTMGVFTIGMQEATGWTFRVNGVEIDTQNLNRWWDDVDTGSGLTQITIGVQSRFTIGHMVWYVKEATNANVYSIEEELANFYHITLDA